MILVKRKRKRDSSKKIKKNPRCLETDEVDWKEWFNQDDPSMQPVRHGNKVIELIDGIETYKKMVDAIEAAIKTPIKEKPYIYILSWYLNLDFDLVPQNKKKSTKLIDLLTSASKSKVQIRAMLWKNIADKGWQKKEAKRINKLATGAAILDENHIKPSTGFNPPPVNRKVKAHAGWGTHHQKILIVKGSDGLIGFCGGFDFNPDRINRVPLGKKFGPKWGRGSPLHDVHCEIRGPAAKDLLNIFVDRWQDHTSSKKLDKKKGKLLGAIEPTPKPIEKQFVQIGRTYGNGKNHVGIWNKNKKPWYSFAPNGERTAEKLIHHAIKKSKKFIYIEDQYMISTDIAKVLGNQLDKIDYLVILIPHSSIVDMKRRWEFRLEFILTLRRSASYRNAHKIRIFYLKGAAKPNPKVIPPTTPHSYLHSKLFIIDDLFAVIGSANMNNRGYTHDSEVVAGIFGNSVKNPKFSFAKNLRMQLWAEHLNLRNNPKEVEDPITTIKKYWIPVPPNKPFVGWYNPFADRDDPKEKAIWSKGVLDPRGK